MTARRACRYTLRSKLVPAQLPQGVVVRDRLVERLTTDRRCTIVSAPPGYGKTVAVCQWVDTIDMPVAWLAMDVLDHEAVSFWSHATAALQSALPRFDDEPAMLLAERGVADAVFLGALVAAIEALGAPAVLVLDGLTDIDDRVVLEGLALLVDRVGETLRLVVTTRSDPALPLARWRSQGWVNDMREGDLRLTLDEARAVAAASDPGEQFDVDALHARVDGWPIAFHMALFSRPDLDAEGTGDGTADAALRVGANRSLASYLVGEVLRAMGDDERDVALGLSVLERFDPDMCSDLLGSNANEVVRALLGRGMFLSVVDPRSGMMQFHALFRELMETELGTRDPARRLALHRRATVLWRSRGDLMSAYYHLAAIGETDRARELLVGPAFELVQSGDLAALNDFARRLPTPQRVTQARLATDLATVAFYAEGPRAAGRWCERAARLLDEPSDLHDDERDELTRRVKAVDCAIALADVDLDAAVAGVEAYHRLAAQSRVTSRFDELMPIIAARAMLASRRRDEADMWITRAERITEPEILAVVTVPTLRAWHEWLHGRLDLSVKLADGAVAWLDDHRIGAHHFAFDTLITAGWCQLTVGDVTEAERLARQAWRDSDVLGRAWNRLQAGFLMARLELLAGDPGAALRTIEELRWVVTFDARRAYADRILALEIEALAASGQLSDPAAAIAEVQSAPRRALLSVRFENLLDHEVAALLEDRAAWPNLERYQAEVVLRSRADPATGVFEELLVECASSGWVLPLLGAGTRVDRRLRAVDVERLHPRLAQALARLDPIGRTGVSADGGTRLTGREVTLLELLPTHLSYAEIGGRLFLSVNTVKSNLKSLYRKLGVTTRSQAVQAARTRGLL